MGILNIGKEEKMKNNALPQVRLRNGFSDRNRIKEENKTMQYTDFDERTRIAFCNTLDRAYNVVIEYITRTNPYARESFEQIICKCVLESLYVEQIKENLNYNINLLFEHYFYRTIREDVYNAVLDLIEFLALIDNFISSNNEYKRYKDRFNGIFEIEFVGYRFVEGKIVAITDKNEIEAIEEAIEKNPYEGCKNHISKALDLLADRENKDYSNSIKESISAVESICQIIVGEQTTLGKALKQLEENGIVIDNALKAAFDKMYGYTSNAGGIRHANAFSEEVVDFEDAKYMLVACSAFVNYLIVKIAKTKGNNKS